MLGTTWPVTAKIQAKFYCPADLWGTAQDVMDEQGVDYSEGMTRLIRVLVFSPPEVRPILLAQLPGNAATAVARSILGEPAAESIVTPDAVLAAWRALPHEAERLKIYETIRDELAKKPARPPLKFPGLSTAADILNSEAASHPQGGEDPHKAQRRKKPGGK